MKTCCQCKLEKCLEDFGASKQKKDGLRPVCKACHRDNNRSWREQNPEKSKLVVQEWAARNQAKKRAANAAWIKANPARMRELTSRWQQENRDLVNARLRERRKVTSHRIHHTLSTRIYTAVRKRKLSVSTAEILGYSMPELITHLERQFLEGMTWENFGQWHIDHILPVSSFTIQSVHDPELRAAWSLSNLRPLWAAENHSKHCKVLFLL